MKPLVIDPDALAELSDAQEWYDNRQQGVGKDLHDEVRAALARIRSDPGIGARYRSTEFSFYRVDRFPYIIYYRDLSDILWVAAIAHGRRRPNYWRKRKP